MIRKAKVEDADIIYLLVCALEETTFDKDKFIERFKYNLKDSHKLYYVYEKEKEVLGLISLFVKTQLHHEKKTGEIEELIVDEKYRSKGIGKQLIQFIFQKAKELDLCEVEVSSHSRRVQAHHFYEKNGFSKSHYKLVRKV